MIIPASLKSKLIILACFVLSLAVCASSSFLPRMFVVMFSEKIRNVDALSSYQVSSTINGSVRTDVFSINPKFGLSETILLPPLFYSYDVKCSATGQLLASGKSSTLQRNLNRGVIVDGVSSNCETISVTVVGPQKALRLVAGDGRVLVGDQVKVTDLKWLIEFFSETMPLVLALIFIAITFLYSFSRVIPKDATGVTAVFALWISAVFFLNQTGIFLRVSPIDIPETISSRIGVALAMSALALWIAVFFQGFIVSKENLSRSRLICIAIIIGSVVMSLTPHHRLLLAFQCFFLAALSIFISFRKSSFAAFLLGACLCLDALKIAGFETIFSSRTSWFFFCSLLTLDVFVRQFGYSRVQWLMHKLSSDLSKNAENLSDALTNFKRITAEELGFSSVDAIVSSKQNTVLTDLRKGINVSVQVDSDKMVDLKLAQSTFFNLDIPASKDCARFLVGELEMKLPSLLLRVIDVQTRRFDACIDDVFSGQAAITGELEVVQKALSQISEKLGLRLFIAEYRESDHQVKPIYVLGYPENIKQRFEVGFLRALPENLYSPISRGVHSQKPYSCPDVRSILPHLHENTVDFYKETKTISCFSFNVKLKVGGRSCLALVYAESSKVRFDEHFRPCIEKFRGALDSLLQTVELSDQLQSATNALSRFIPRTHVFALMSGSSVTEADCGYLLMVDLKGSTKFSLKYGSECWLEKVEKLQTVLKPAIEREGFSLQTFSWDAAFITLSAKEPKHSSLVRVERLGSILGALIQNWAESDTLLKGFWGLDEQKARLCLTFGDISRGLATGTTETWTVVGESMAVIAKMESECKKLDGVFFTDSSVCEDLDSCGYSNTHQSIRGVDREIYVRYRSWIALMSAKDDIESSNFKITAA